MKLAFESERLEFRPFELNDLDLAIELWTDPDVAKYITGDTIPKQKLSDEMPIAVRRCAGGCIGIWCLTEKTTQEKLGTAVLLPMPVNADDTDWDLVTGDAIPEGDIEIGYVLKKSAWGQGFATEACRRLMRFAFEDSPLNEVVAVIDPDNSASRHVLEKCGLVAEGLVRAYGEDIPGFRLTLAQWRQLQGKGSG